MAPAAHGRFPSTDTEPAFTALAAGAQRIASSLENAGHALRADDTPGPREITTAVEQQITPAVIDALAARTGDGRDPLPAFGAAWAREWLLQSANLADHLAELHATRVRP